MSVGDLLWDDLTRKNLDQFSVEIIEQLPIGLIVIDRSGYIVAINSFQEKISGIRRADIVGECLFHNPKLGHSEIDKILQDVLENGQSWRGSEPFFNNTAEKDKVYFSEIQPFRKYNEIVGAVMLTHEITEPQLLSRRFPGADADLKGFFDHFGDGLMVISPDFSIQKINAAQLALFELDKKACYVGKRCFRELFGRNSVCTGCPALDSFDTKLPAVAELQLSRHESQHKTINVRSMPILDGNTASRVLISCRPVHQLVRDQEMVYLADLINQDYREFAQKLETLNLLHSSVLNGVSEALILVKADHRVIYWNKAAEKTFDLFSEQALGENLFTLVPELSGSDLKNLIKTTLEIGKIQGIEVLRHKTIRSEAYLRIHTFPISGYLPFQAVLIRIEDVSDLKEKIKQEKLGNRISAIGKFSARLAHNINNPLGTILNTIDFLRMDALEKPDFESLQRDLEVIRHQVFRISHFTEDLLSLATESKDDFIVLDVNLVLEKTLALIEIDKENPGVHIEFMFAKSLPLIMGNEDRLELAFKHLVINAIEAIEKHGAITVTTMPYGNQSQDVMITINDDGRGIEANLLPKIFDPYVTTKKNAKGAGLGLTVAFAIILNHQGTMDIKSRPERGTQVAIFLPGLKGEQIGANFSGHA